MMRSILKQTPTLPAFLSWDTVILWESLSSGMRQAASMSPSTTPKDNGLYRLPARRHLPMSPGSALMETMQGLLRQRWWRTGRDATHYVIEKTNMSQKTRTKETGSIWHTLNWVQQQCALQQLYTIGLLYSTCDSFISTLFLWWRCLPILCTNCMARKM